MSTLIFRNIFNQDTRLAFLYVKLSVRLKLLESQWLFKTPCQNHARKAEETSNFHRGQALPRSSSPQVHTSLRGTVERLIRTSQYKGLPFLPCWGWLGCGRNSGILEVQFSTSFHQKNLLEIINEFRKDTKSIHTYQLHF